MRGTVLIVGGGLAGLAAACDLADAGYRVTLLEKRPFLGGRAYSYVDGRSGQEVDNGQHVFLRCCTEYIAFLKRLGVRERTHLQRRLYLRLLDKLTGKSVLQADRLPAPFHLLRSFLRYRPLSLGEKLLAAYALFRLHSLDRARHPELDSISFREWLRAHGQTEHIIRSFWEVIVRPTLNEESSQASADLAAMVFQEGLLRDRDAGAIGYARVGLSTLLEDAARRYLEARGATVRLGCGVRELLLRDGVMAGVALENGEALQGDWVVVALPPGNLLSLLPPALREEPFFARFGRFQGSPIVNVHLWFDRPVMSIPFAAFLNSPLQWAFNKTRLWGTPGEEQHLDISLSAAYFWEDWPGRDLIEVMHKEVMAFFPAARTAALRWSLVVKQPWATFAPRPGVRALRPGPVTPVANLLLAGDWTDTGWPATMESAVRSGRQAARALVRRAGERGESAFAAEKALELSLGERP
ncbi:15-cis-phytoene desaturase [bacterium HR25]|jgi:squalene-associated FAD-dependent desaturase|nr:15-cis-phytoene desaturase [bacterium HR25]